MKNKEIKIRLRVCDKLLSKCSKSRTRQIGGDAVRITGYQLGNHYSDIWDVMGGIRVTLGEQFNKTR